MSASPDHHGGPGSLPSGGSGTGVPVVLLHGARTSSTMWRAQVRALRGGRRVVAPDLPGHGSRRGEPFTLDAGLDTVRAAIDSVGGRAVVVGLSLGGYLALTVAAREPSRVVGVVAAGCSTSPGGPLTWGWRQAVRVIERSPDRGAWLNRTLVRLLLPEQGAADVAEGGFALDVMGDLIEEIGRLRPLRELPAVTCPLWLVNGRWDHFRRQERQFLRAATGAASARLVVVPGASHLVSLVRPVAFTRVLLEVLDECDRAAAAEA
ncbi:alpha/beta fold hydrolase [Actinotalea sp.]|uniref:alpha/beta fold hydrolase n=1 Tax=Actinotalea sp. TaxID=1872145 RepID=UPI003568B60F